MILTEELKECSGTRSENNEHLCMQLDPTTREVRIEVRDEKQLKGTVTKKQMNFDSAGISCKTSLTKYHLSLPLNMLVR